MTISRVPSGLTAMPLTSAALHGDFSFHREARRVNDFGVSLLGPLPSVRTAHFVHCGTSLFCLVRGGRTSDTRSQKRPQRKPGILGSGAWRRFPRESTGRIRT